MPPVVLIVTPRPSSILPGGASTALRRRDLSPLVSGHARHRPYVSFRSGCGLAEIRRAYEPVHAEHTQPLFAHRHALADEAGQPRIVLGNGLAALFLVHGALTEHLVDHERNAAAALAHDQETRALGGLGPLAEQEAVEI